MVALASILPVEPVLGPDDPSEGFVSDFLTEVNDNDSKMRIAGDVVDLNPAMEYEGYLFDDVTLLAGDRPGDVTSDEKYSEARRAVIVMRPTEDAPVPTLQTKFDLGFLACDGITPIIFTISPADRFAHAICYNPDDHSIAITVRFGYDDVDIDGDSNTPHSAAIYVEEDSILYNSNPISTVFLDDIWDAHQNAVVSEGVTYTDSAVPSHLSDLLNRQISELAASEPVDYHPGSEDHVRDLVHPSLFCFVQGESPITGAGERTARNILRYNRMMTEGTSLDRWGRRFESSIYQWLPTVFRIGEDHTTSIHGYINNLDRNKYPGLYDSLARLFEVFLPYFEMVYAYAQSLNFRPDGIGGEDDDPMDAQLDYNPDYEASRFSGTDLLVITKIIDYELHDDNDSVEGVFHVEGMSTDHIIMTGVYVVDRDEETVGGDILFRRAFLDFEASALFGEIAQSRHWRAEQIVDECVRPLGKLETPKGRLFVFPNSHIHKVEKIWRDASATGAGDECKAVARRRIVVFWVVDPERDVITTQHVSPQNATMTLDRAKEHRLALMEERSRYKGLLNGERKINLCEH